MRSLLLALSLSIGLCASANAAGLYLGGNLGFANLDCRGCRADPNLGAKLVVGYDILPYYVALESGYAYLSGHGDQEDRQQQSAYLAGVFSYPLTKEYLLSFKVGGSYSRSEAEISSSNGVITKSKGDWTKDLYYGVAMSLWLDKHDSVRLEYERFSKEDSPNLHDADLFSLGWVHRF